MGRGTRSSRAISRGLSEKSREVAGKKWQREERQAENSENQASDGHAFAVDPSL
jgi:post-segregation antitoxin (ccd killing protein)